VTEQRLTDLFIPYLSPKVRQQISSAHNLEQTLHSVLRLARDAWPAFSLSEQTFLPFLAQHLPEGRSVERSLAELKVADLYLACACLQGQAAAVAAFKAEVLPATEAALARMETATVQVADIQQLLTQKLLVGDDRHPPKLALYSGSGDLRSWLCVTAVRTALDILRREKDCKPLDDGDMADSFSEADDQELQYLKRIYRKEFKDAFQESLSTLTSRERNILRHLLLDGLTLDQVAALHNVHRATIARWNARLREKLLKATRRSLQARLHTSAREFDSIMRLIQSQFDVSIVSHLNKDD
jgi:RNA polymerase sigma-70 factor (ECF subfamily)